MPAIIKSEHAAARSGKVAFNFDDLNHQATAYLDQIKVHATKIVSDARGEADSIRQKAAEAGRAEALAAASAAAVQRVEEQLKTLAPALALALSGIDAARDACQRAWEGRIVHIAALMAQRIVRGEIARNPHVPAEFIREALTLATGSPSVRLLLSPTDEATLRPVAERLAKEMGRLGPVTIVADASISPGGCRVETRFGAIDQTVEAQLARIEEELAG